ncbi:hypothetical protein Tco_0276873 [Tanacetum coccineum]
MEVVIIVNVLRQAGADVVLALVEPELEVCLSSGVILITKTSISECYDQVFDLGLKSVRYGVSNGFDTAYREFLGVGTTHRYAVSSLMDTAYWLSEQ